jgi:hypothetical protein
MRWRGQEDEAGALGPLLNAARDRVLLCEALLGLTLFFLLSFSLSRLLYIYKNMYINLCIYLSIYLYIYIHIDIHKCKNAFLCIHVYTYIRFLLRGLS